MTDPNERYFFFDKVKPKSKQLLGLLSQIAEDPTLFQGAIERRIALFTPPGADIQLQGYIVAGGDGGGYAFGDTNFYLNIGIVVELVVARCVTTHELYHAVQGAFPKDRGQSLQGHVRVQTHSQKACSNTSHLFANLYEEGSATYVADPSLLAEAHSAVGLKMRDDMAEGLKHIHTSVSLLEMSVISLSAADSMPYDDVYAVGFYGHGILYAIGYVMAKAIVERDGSQGLAASLGQLPYRFVLRYTQLPEYGMDKDHPALGPNTLDAVKQIASVCK